jgi:hypothetical protein
LHEIQPDEKLLRRIEWTNGVVLILLTLGGWFFGSTRAAISIFLGGGIVTLSFQILKWQLRAAFKNPGRIPSKAGLFVSYYLRFLGTLFVIFVVMYYGWVDPIPFLVGLSVVALSVVVVGGREFLLLLAKKGET